MAQHRLPEGYDVGGTSAPATTRGTSGCVWPPMETCSRPSATARPTSSPTPSTGSPTGIRLASGAELDADIIVTATGLNIQLFGGAKIGRNGEPIDLGQRMAYRAMMLDGLPNIAFTFGYTNASWTLKADLVSEYVCRLLNYMAEHGYDTVVARHRATTSRSCRSPRCPPATCRRDEPAAASRGSRGPWQTPAELPLRHPRHPAGQDRRSGAALHQTPCGGARFGLIGSLLEQTCCGDDDDAVVVAVGDLAGDERHPAERRLRRRARRLRSWCSCAGWCPAP